MVLKMSDLKKAFIGGYKKSAVDEVINALNEKLEKAEANEKQISRKLDNSESKIAELENQIEQLQLENENLKKTNNNVFGDIAKVYKRAYDAGYDIVSESKDTTVNFLNDIYNRFDGSLEDTETALAKYEDIRYRIDQALSALNEGLRDIADSTSMILDKARSFSGVYGQMKDIMLSAVKDSENSLKEYENYSSEFLAVRETSEAENVFPSVEPEVTQIAKEKAEPVTETAEPSAKTPVTADAEIETENNLQADVITDSTEFKESADAEEAHTPAEPAAPVAADITAEPAAHTEDAVSTETDEPADPDAHTGPVVIVASAVNAVRNGSVPAQPAPAQVHSDRTAGFTQFGRKTKISPEDRNELIRKALMRNAGN